jgi:hypothetical protein
MNEVGVDIEDKGISLHKDNDVKKVFMRMEIENKHQMGGNFDKRKVEAVIEPTNDRRESNKMRLVLKQVMLGHDNILAKDNSKSIAEKYVEIWKMFKEAGIPTVSSMRVVDDDTVAMGDMTADGSQFFGKARSEEVWYFKELKERPLTEMENKFMKIEPEEIEAEFERIQNIAWNKGLRLPSDDLFDILVHPDGSWQLLVIDLSYAKLRKDESVDELKDENKLVVEDVNTMRDYYLNISKNK